jgi:hypothetical protein
VSTLEQRLLTTTSGHEPRGSPRFKHFSKRFLPDVRTTMLTDFRRTSQEPLSAGWTLATDITVRWAQPIAGRLGRDR